MNFTDNLAPEKDQCHTAKNYMGLQTTEIEHNIARYGHGDIKRCQDMHLRLTLSRGQVTIVRNGKKGIWSI